jgi:hypothetical protein
MTIRMKITIRTKNGTKQILYLKDSLEQVSSESSIKQYREIHATQWQ